VLLKPMFLGRNFEEDENFFRTPISGNYSDFIDIVCASVLVKYFVPVFLSKYFVLLF
jgi:hypothetical protein